MELHDRRGNPIRILCRTRTGWPTYAPMLILQAGVAIAEGDFTEPFTTWRRASHSAGTWTTGRS